MKPTPRLMLVTNRLATRLPLLDVVRVAVQGGVDTIQVREKDLSFGELRNLVAQIMNAAPSATVVVNGSIDVARQLGIGVHLPEVGPSSSDARVALGPDALIGRSVHPIDGGRQSEDVDYLIAGHVFETASKAGSPAIGLDELCRLTRSTNVPVVAIGGINRQNARSVIDAGAKGAAIMSAINQSEDPGAEAEAIRSQLEGISITLNGRKTTIAPNLTIQEFLFERGFKDRLVVVEINGKIAVKSSYSVRVFEPEDSVEVVHFVGGG